MNLITSTNSTNKLSLTQPVKGGTLTNYGKILLYAYKGSGIYSKVELLENALNKNFGGGKASGYYSTVFSSLNLNNLVIYHAEKHRLEAGSNLKEYVKTYLADFI